MKQEYIVVNKTKLNAILAEIENYTYATQNVYIEGKNEGKRELIEMIYESNSTPLEPIISDAFEAGQNYGWDITGFNSRSSYDNDISKNKEQYINNLKLDI